MDFAPLSHILSPPRPSSPTHTNSSSATRVEPAFFDFFLKKADNSPCLMTSDIGPGTDHSGSPHSGSPPAPLSPVDEVSNSPVVREDLLHSPSRRGKREFTSLSHRGKPGHTPAMKESLLHSPSPRESHHMSSPSCRKCYAAYSSCHLSSQSPNSSLPPRLSSPPASPLFGKFTMVSLLELHISAHIAEHEELMMKGLAEMNLLTMYKLFKARLAGREAACQCLAVTAWAIQEAKHYLEFSEALNKDSKMRLKYSDEEFRRVRAALTGRHHSDIENDGNYLQAAYNDKCNTLRAIAAQADAMGKILGLNVKNDLLSSRGESSHRPQFTSSADPSDSHMSSDLDGDDHNGTMDSDDDKESEGHDA
ncbi:uncharacterized protein F5891DRAFT_1193785 [Suillus fuscotomentosus]|uniref:Uncharacterized protein n=1 Tax=Suillus fuscotomentosus TaxID=1912939 RepID=A0AAD4DX82_9AGAM|nr:uncharacterized protein F5891DRAFT_1193785 [Suillus fuscotomentosus]KAG1895779.1 hypothetical protein F5891DRAFT_1193785 [Suillus fuscotomentosus]